MEGDESGEVRVVSGVDWVGCIGRGLGIKRKGSMWGR